MGWGYLPACGPALNFGAGRTTVRKHHLSIRAARAPGLAIAIALGLGLTSVASAQLVPKQLSGPASEFAAMRAPDPVESTIHSRSALIPVDMLAAKSGSRGQNRLGVENGTLRFALLAPDPQQWSVSLVGPNGQKLAAADTAKRASVSSFGMEGAQVPARLFHFDSMPKGAWQVEVTGPKNAQRAFLLLEGDADTELASHTWHGRQLVGETLGLTTQLTGVDGKGKALTGAAAGRIERAWINLTGPDGSTTTLPMYDDGLNGDGKAGDGIYGAGFLAKQAGDHTAQVMIEGVDRHGNRVLRSTEHLLPVLEPSISLNAKRASASIAKGGDSRLSIQIGVNAAKSTSHYRSYAEVWGRDAHGNELPVAWVGGMVTPERGQLKLGFDERWVAKAQAQGPFELRNLRIEDPDHSITLASASRMPLSLPPLRVRAKAGEISIDESMLMGERPADLVTAKASGKRLLLVHGYCSAGVWPTGHFSTASTFLDKHQNRTHDQFAQRIRNFGASWNSFGVVAHSQGGAAALHLYSYYWSGLDNATGNRLIQSVGTPYQGTNLAGILATLGNWFGVGCGNNSNLTYSGAKSWLAGIPTWARAKVNYYTTSFKHTNWWTNDYCNFATDLVLNDPEDGTVEQVNAQLPGAINRGHVTGQCHTAGMRDPAQYLNASRNSTMNANAAR